MEAKIKNFVKKYYPDILIVGGITLLTFFIVSGLVGIPPVESVSAPPQPSFTEQTKNAEFGQRGLNYRKWVTLAVFVMALGLDIAVRRAYKEINLSL